MYLRNRQTPVLDSVVLDFQDCFPFQISDGSGSIRVIRPKIGSTFDTIGGCVPQRGRTPKADCYSKATTRAYHLAKNRRDRLSGSKDYPYQIIKDIKQPEENIQDDPVY